MHAHMLLGTVGVSSGLLADEIRITIAKAAHVKKQLARHCAHGPGASPTERSRCKDNYQNITSWPHI